MIDIKKLLKIDLDDPQQIEQVAVRETSKICNELTKLTEDPVAKFLLYLDKTVIEGQYYNLMIMLEKINMTGDYFDIRDFIFDNIIGFNTNGDQPKITGLFAINTSDDEKLGLMFAFQKGSYIKLLETIDNLNDDSDKLIINFRASRAVTNLWRNRILRYFLVHRTSSIMVAIPFVATLLYMIFGEMTWLISIASLSAALIATFYYWLGIRKMSKENVSNL